MSHDERPDVGRVSRRSAVGILGATSVAVGTAVSLAGVVNPVSANAEPLMSAPPALRPGGPFDRALAQRASQDEFSGIVMICYRGNPVLSRSYGAADKQRQIPNRSDTIFALASVTKLFTATAIIQLLEQGKLTLGASLGTYLPDWPADLKPLTIHQLLTHTSGMSDYHASDTYKDRHLNWSSAEQVMNGITGVIKDMPLLFTPGTASSYSNSGYVTLGAIVGQLTGQSYAAYYDYVRTHIFKQAKMIRADFFTRNQWQKYPEIAHPYSVQPDGSRADVSGTSGDWIGNPAGNAFASAPDMVRYARALLGGRLLGRSWAELMISPKGPGSGDQNGMGTNVGSAPPGGGTASRTAGGAAESSPGVQTASGCYGGSAVIFNDQRIVSMNGGGPGETTSIDIYPDLDWNYVYLSNYDNIRPTGQEATMTERQAITQASR